MALLVDSSVFVALFLDRDPQHAKAVRFMKNSGIQKCVVPYCVMSETATVLTYKHSKELADHFLHFVRDAANIELVADDTGSEAAAFLQHSARISFTDSALLHLVPVYDAELVTFDKQLARLAKKFQ